MRVRLASTQGEGDRELPAAGVFLAIGHTPNTGLLKGQVELTEKGYVRWTKPFARTPASKACLLRATSPTTTTARR